MNRAAFFKEVSRDLDAIGVAHRFETKGRSSHPRVYYQTDAGCDRFYVLPGTVSDRRALQNCIADLRRIIGKRPGIKKSNRPKRRKRVKAEPPLVVPSITQGRDYTPALIIARERAVSGDAWPVVQAASLRIRQRADLAVELLGKLS